MPSRTKSGELPKPVLQTDRLGCLPVNAITVSYLAQAQTELLIGLRDTEETRALRRQPSLQVRQGTDIRPLSLEGRIFNGYSDALYRGQLPEAILAAPAAELWTECLKDFVEYLEKLLSLGFFLPRKQLAKRDPVSELIPCIILSGSGLLFSRFISSLTQKMASLEYEHPEFNETVRMDILGRFVRGLPSDGPEGFPEGAGPEASMAGGPIDLLETATTIRIAGGSHSAREILARVLAAYGLTVRVENGVRNPVERLEFENALWRITHVVFPALVAHQRVSPEEIRLLAGRVEQGILTIGRKRLAFRESEQHTVEALPGKKAESSGQVNPQPAREDAEILSELSHYADLLGLPEEKALFEMLCNQLT